MATELLVKDVGEIYARIFDHRPIIQQEINFMVKEFEERRKWREESNLRETLDVCHQLGQDEVPQAINCLQKTVPDMLAKLKTANEMCAGILDREHRNPQIEWLKVQRNDRVKEWISFMDKMCEKSKAIDEEYDNDLQQAQMYYNDLEEKLKLTPSSPSHSTGST